MRTKSPIYFDYNATTPVAEKVLESMIPYFSKNFGNPSSLNHSYGWTAKMAIDQARQQVANAISCASQEIYFTSGATESNNLAILGFLLNQIMTKKKVIPHVVTSHIEHPSVLEVCEMAKNRWGAEITYVPCDNYGQISLEKIQEAIQPNTCLISIMMANNEIGTINPIKEIGQWAKSQSIFFHTDCAQTFGKLNIDVEEMGIDLLSLSGHKIYGPKGVGALYVRAHQPTVELVPLMAGGSQEQQLRPGTLNVPSIVGLGRAAELAMNEKETETIRLRKLQERLIKGILEAMPKSACLNGHPTERIFTNVSFSFKDISADFFPLYLSDLALSSGSACTSGSPFSSHVLKAIGLSEEMARATLRFGLGHFTSPQDIDIAIEKVTLLSQAPTL